MSHQRLFLQPRVILWAGTLTLAFLAHAPVLAASRNDNPIILAVKHGDCKAAVELLATGVDAKDDEAIFLAGRMLDEGICLRQDAEGSTRFFERASSHGHHDGGLEFAAKIGMGAGAEQNFERAGEVCRSSGLDPQGQLSSYALGYACTLRAVAGKMLRVTLPAGAFRPNSGDAIVEFNPGSADLRVKSTPQVARESEAAIGSNIAKKRIHADREIKTAWEKARAMVPKPDPQKLDAKFVELSLDIETALESANADENVPAGMSTLDLLDPPKPILFQR